MNSTKKVTGATLRTNENRPVWQIATGDGSRNYFSIFLKFGVALVGPGDPGKAGEEATIQFYQEHEDRKNWGAVLRQIGEGDWIIARKGRKVILGIGKVRRAYNYSHLFEDVEGWDLQHFVKVDWYVPNNESGSVIFDKVALGMSTLEGCNNPVVFDKIREIEFEYQAPTVPDNWSLPKTLELGELSTLLINKGIRIRDAEEVLHTIRRVKTLAKWYYDHDFDASEDEIRAFLVLPFFMALGWSEQKMKLEYNKIDVALFANAFLAKNTAEDKMPEVIVEVKAYDNGLSFTKNQAAHYGKFFDGTKKFVTTNGYRYIYYEKKDGELMERGSFNLLRLRERNNLFPSEEYLNTVASIFAISNFR